VKMSKSRGNVVDPNEVVDQYGADVLRTYVLFMGDYEQAAPWSENSMKGCKRFIDRIWNLQEILTDGDEYSQELTSAFHKTIKKVTEDIEGMKFNTAIAALMTLINEIYAKGSINKAELKTFLLLVNPFAPHITEEIYSTVYSSDTVLVLTQWPDFDEAKCKDETIEIAVQVNGKIKARLNVPADAEQDEVLAMCHADENVKNAIGTMNVIKQFYVKGKLVNIVVKP
ncbi:MAG: class I tRNA ligase family protein, partial [Ruminococcus sp.]|nr:class I tRNA ligase family protein [Ruminococcus sp.]